METVLTCPLGHKCQEAKDGKVYQCNWYVKLVGKDPQSLKEYDEWGCAMQWMPVLLIENSQRQVQTNASIESFRNEMVEGNGSLIGLINQARLTNESTD